MKRKGLITILFSFIVACAFSQSTPRELFKFAKFKYDNGEYTEALDYLNQTLDQDDAYVNAWLLRAEVNYILENYEKAVSDINKALELDPSSGTSHYSKYLVLKGKSYALMNKLNDAVSLFKKVLAEDPYDAAANFELGYVKYLQKENFEALDLINKAIKIEPKNAKFYAMRAMITQKTYNVFPDSDLYGKIMDDYNLAIYLDKDNYEFYKLRSDFKKAMGQSQEAMADYNKMIELDPKKNIAYTKRGILKMQEEKYSDAIEDFSTSINIHPKDANSYRYRGLCLHNLRKYYEAYNDFSKTINILNDKIDSAENKSLKDKLADTYLMRGHSLYAMGKGSEACVDFLKALDLGERKGLNYFRKYCKY